MAELGLAPQVEIVKTFIALEEGKLSLIFPNEKGYNPDVKRYRIEGTEVFSEEELSAQEIMIIKDALKRFSHYKGFYTKIAIAAPEKELGYTQGVKIYVQKGELFPFTLYHELSHVLYNLLPKRARLEIAYWYFEMLSLDKGLKEEGIWRTIDESHVFGLDKKFGHPYDNAGEMFASTLTVLRFGKVDLEGLNKEEKATIKNMLKTIEKHVPHEVFNP